MREIKLRAWDKRHKRMRPVLEIHWSTHGEAYLVTVPTKAAYIKGKPVVICEASPERMILMQCTGLHDKNGKEIFEGDILRNDVGDLGIVRFGKLPLDKSGDCVCSYLAFYVECRGQIGRAPSFECAEIGDWMEIIGNIYENPELMEPQ